MKRSVSILLVLCVLPWHMTAAEPTEPLTIAFGSCLRQWKPQPIWEAVRSVEPRLFIFGGDNVYTGTGPYRFLPEPERIGLAYEELATVPGFQRLRAEVPILATWDDHDYGRNNAGAEYPYKEEAKDYFLDFFQVPADAPLRQRPGIYHAHDLESPAGTVQIILLDTRTFRSPLVEGETNRACPRSRLVPSPDPKATILGDAQWAWLETQLQRPAALRLIVSSIQVIPDQHCFEKWANFPNERRRLLELLGRSGVGPVILLSGDRHLAEISRLPGTEATPPLYELTSSSMNAAGAGKGESNRYRVTADNVRVDNFGVVRITPGEHGPAVRVQIRGTDGAIIQEVVIPPA